MIVWKEKIMRLVIKKLKIADRNKILLDIPELMVNFSSLALMGPSGSEIGRAHV